MICDVWRNWGDDMFFVGLKHDVVQRPESNANVLVVVKTCSPTGGLKTSFKHILPCQIARA